ncbi:hypothetical protein Hanom_Chr10g00948451 [Helianthus anomalus]
MVTVYNQVLRVEVEALMLHMRHIWGNFDVTLDHYKPLIKTCITVVLITMCPPGHNHDLKSRLLSRVTIYNRLGSLWREEPSL